MPDHTVIVTNEGMSISVNRVYSPNEDSPAVFPSVLTDKVFKSDPIAVAKPKPFFRINDAGKQQFCVRFASGAVQVIATET